MTTALYAGSFDPITFGHLSVMLRAKDIFNKLIIGVGINPTKESFFSAEQRVKFIQTTLVEHGRQEQGFPYRNIDVFQYDTLTIEFAKKVGANILIRGIRDEADLRNELYLARINKRLSGLETLFLGPEDGHIMASSTFVRQVWQFGKDVQLLSGLVPRVVLEALS